jgi:hypothetical protein
MALRLKQWWGNMGKGGGGGFDTSALERSTEEALALQKEIYGQTRGDVAPWYNMGVGSVSKLSDLLGIGGGSMQTREQLMSQLSPQFTTQNTMGNANQYVDKNGQVVTVADPKAYIQANIPKYSHPAAGNNIRLNQAMEAAGKSGDYTQAMGALGYNPYQTTTQSTDTAGLNAAVEAALANQKTPEGYGSLLERFDLSKFQEDPSYQYRQEQSNKALERAMAAQGVTLGGGGYGTINPQVASALQEQNQNLASQEYNNAYGRYNQDNLNIYNMLMGSAGMGQNATNTMANAGTNYVNAATDLNTSLASAQTNAQIAKASQPSMFGQILGAVAPMAIGAFTGGMSSLFSGGGGAAAGSSIANPNIAGTRYLLG